MNRPSILLVAAVILVLGCASEPSPIAPAGSVEDLQGTIDVLTRQLGELESENARLRRECSGGAAAAPRRESTFEVEPAVGEADAQQVASSPPPPPPTEVQASAAALTLVNVKGRATERNDSWWRWAWVMEVHNSSNQPVAFDVTIKWVDDEGFPIDEGREYGLQIGPNASKTFNGTDLVSLPGAMRVAAVKAELQER